MKKFLATFLTLAIMAVMVPLSVDAQTRSGKRYNRNYNSRNYERNNKNVYQRHRNAFNIGIGGAAGAIIGGIIGGKKGALIGAGVGAGSGAAYTYGIKPKKKTRRYYRRQ
jgi:outer membrane lipoprotein SlyB